MITSRLPLALPPHSVNPTLYAIGLQAFAQVYMTFESVWQTSIHDVVFKGDFDNGFEDCIAKVDQDMGPQDLSGSKPNMLRFLSNLLPEGLERSERLQSDLLALNEITSKDPRAVYLKCSLPKMEQFALHIRHTVVRKPHVLVAYAWIMYMAIFSGGRWIRAELLSAGKGFWVADNGECGSRHDLNENRLEEDSYLQNQLPGLLFLSFDDVDDGKSIKATFKERLLNAEHMLSTEERIDILEEACEIFRFNIALVEELDNVIVSFQRKDPSNRHFEYFPSSSGFLGRNIHALVQLGMNKCVWLVAGLIIMWYIFSYIARLTT